MEGVTLPRGALTGPPQLLALLLVGEAHAVVAVGVAALTGGAVHLVEIGGAVRRLARAELGEVALPRLLTAQGARGQKLSQGMRRKETVNHLPARGLATRACERHPRGTESPGVTIS